MVCFFVGGNIPLPPLGGSPHLPPRPVRSTFSAKPSWFESKSRKHRRRLAWHDWSLLFHVGIQHGNQAIKKKKNIPRQLGRKHVPPGRMFSLGFGSIPLKSTTLTFSGGCPVCTSYFRYLRLSIDPGFGMVFIYIYPHFIRKSQLSSCRFKIGFHKPVCHGKKSLNPTF